MMYASYRVPIIISKQRSRRQTDKATFRPARTSLSAGASTSLRELQKAIITLHRCVFHANIKAQGMLVAP
jgi:hypothetical protein